MSRRTAAREDGSQPLDVPAARTSRPQRPFRWLLLALAAAYVAASLSGWQPRGFLSWVAYAPPILGFAFLATFFALTLRSGSEPLVARVARREHPHLGPELAAYTRGLTLLWTSAFVLLALVSAAMAATLTFMAWSRWTHALAIAVPASLFFGEYLYRLRRFPHHSHAPPPRLFVNIVRTMSEAFIRDRRGKLPLLQCRSGNDPLLLDRGHTVLVGQFLGQVRALAAALPEATYVINLCERRHTFLVAFGAAMMRGQVSLLPPGHSPGDWERLLEKYPGATVLGDGLEDAPEGWLDVTPHLDCDAFATDVPWVDAHRTAVILFTSGSTGESVGHAKSWRQFWCGARAWAGRLGWEDTSRIAIVGSVPPQHMFGFESTVVLPFHAGVPVHAHRPLLPADLDAALRRDGRGFWWMTTPIHLRAAVASSIEAPNLLGVVSSTMNLPPATARAAEARWNVPVVELYGSTETGALATRRCALEEPWLIFPDVALRPSEDGVLAEGERLGTPIRLGDLLEFTPDGRFFWRGRIADMVKVAGKRASLAALERRLQEIEGIQDATFFVPETDGAEVKRLVAFYVSDTLEPDSVIEALRHSIDAVFVPRSLYRVRALPRNANGKLTRAALSQLHESCRFPERFMIPLDHPAVVGHFPGNPVVPGALILARVARQVALRFPGEPGGSVANARFHAPLAPGETALIETARKGRSITFRVKRGDVLLAEGTWRTE